MVMQNNSTDEPISLEFQWQKNVLVCVNIEGDPFQLQRNFEYCYKG